MILNISLEEGLLTQMYDFIVKKKSTFFFNVAVHEPLDKIYIKKIC